MTVFPPTRAQTFSYPRQIIFSRVPRFASSDPNCPSDPLIAALQESRYISEELLQAWNMRLRAEYHAPVWLENNLLLLTPKCA